MARKTTYYHVIIQKIIITCILVYTYFVGMRIGYTSDANIYEHTMFTLCHANIWHLMCNVLALWSIRGKLYLIPSVIINIIASYLSFMDSQTMGFSGVLFSCIGIKWGYYFSSLFTSWVEFNYSAFMYNVKKFLVYTIVPLIITVFIPNVNWKIHAVSIILGLLYGVLWNRHEKRT